MEPTSSEWKIVAYFVRHGATKLNDEGKFRGKLDAPLDENGKLDAKKLKAYFRDKEIGDAWVSDSKRAQETADEILEQKGVVASPDPNLNSIDVGNLAGEKKADHKDDTNYLQEHPEEPFPGGESINQFRSRVRPRIVRSIRNGIDNGVPSMTVTSSSVIHEVGNLIHGDHNICKVRPGGVAGVYSNGGQFKAVPLIRAAKGEGVDKTYAS
jgi:broad specificity phosphatase PhoE